MPLPIIPLIAAGATLAAGGIQAGATARQNRLSREFSREQYLREQQQAVNLWKMQTEYNSPASQVSRLNAAGLNPALMYGKHGSTGQASSIPNSTGQRPEFRVNDFGQYLGTAMQHMVDIETKQQQVQNMKTDQLAKLAQIELINTQTGRGKYDLGLEKDLRDVSLDMRKEQLRSLRKGMEVQDASIAKVLDSISSQALDRAKTKEEIENVKQLRKNLKSENYLKGLDAQLRKLGINPNDPLFLRVLARILNNNPDNLSKIIHPGEGGWLGIIQSLFNIKR